MPKDYLRFLELSCKKFKKENKEIFDIVIYGSFVKGKMDFNDIDLMVVFLETSLEKRLEIAQKLKFLMKKEIEKIDIKTMNFADFFDENFLARQGVIMEGKSLIKNKSLAELFGFDSFAVFSYKLKNLNHNKKTQFVYALSGRNNKGVLESLNGISLGRGVALIPMHYSNEFEAFLQGWNIVYSLKKVLVSKL